MKNKNQLHEGCLHAKLEEGKVSCYLCSHRCVLDKSGWGICGVRQNIDGALYTYSYGQVIASHSDPVEKKPLYHFLPGSHSFSIASIGCNFRCGFCQNWEISQQSFKEAMDRAAGCEPQAVVDAAISSRCESISYTYTEPTIFFEFASDVASRAKSCGIKNIFVTNGFMSRECIERAAAFLDAANVDLKFFSDASYQNVCGGRLEPVKESIRLLHEKGVWVEVTTLIVPGLNDSDGELRSISAFLASLDVTIPWHISRFHPDYKMTASAVTPQGTLARAYRIGCDAGLRFVYGGNVSGWGNDTYCPGCKKLLIKREGFDVLEYNVKKGACQFCARELPGVYNR